jgi:hypothetical protein
MKDSLLLSGNNTKSKDENRILKENIRGNR